MSLTRSYSTWTGYDYQLHIQITTLLSRPQNCLDVYVRHVGDPSTFFYSMCNHFDMWKGKHKLIAFLCIVSHSVIADHLVGEFWFYIKPSWLLYSLISVQNGIRGTVTHGIRPSVVQTTQHTYLQKLCFTCYQKTLTCIHVSNYGSILNTKWICWERQQSYTHTWLHSLQISYLCFRVYFYSPCILPWTLMQSVVHITTFDSLWCAGSVFLFTCAIRELCEHFQHI